MPLLKTWDNHKPHSLGDSVDIQKQDIKNAAEKIGTREKVPRERNTDVDYQGQKK